MVCPRCDRARIERDGAVIRCAVCGMSYDPRPNITTEASGNWLAAAAFGREQDALHVTAGYLAS
jgi:ribosomal protein L37AE/L43A